MYFAFAADGCVAEGFEMLHRGRVLHANLFGHVLDAVYRAKPNDVFYIDVVANQGFGVVVNVDDAHQSVSVLSEIIQKRRVLAERMITIKGSVGRRFVVAKQDDKALTHFFFQLGAASYVSLLVEHDNNFC